MFKTGDIVNINFHDERIPGIIASEIGGKLFGNPGTMYTVKLLKNNRAYVKAISDLNLTPRYEEDEVDTELQTLPKLNPWDRGYSKFKEYTYFHRKGYRTIIPDSDGVCRPYLRAKHKRNP